MLNAQGVADFLLKSEEGRDLVEHRTCVAWSLEIKGLRLSWFELLGLAECLPQSTEGTEKRANQMLSNGAAPLPAGRSFPAPLQEESDEAELRESRDGDEARVETAVILQSI